MVDESAADVLREMDSLLVIRVESMGAMGNSEVTGAALSIITNKKDEGFAVNCLDSIDFTLKIDDNLIRRKRLRRFYLYMFHVIALQTMHEMTHQ